MNADLMHLQVADRQGRPGARCYWRVPIENTTTDPSAVTCGKCRRTRAFKDLVVEAEPVLSTTPRLTRAWRLAEAAMFGSGFQAPA